MARKVEAEYNDFEKTRRFVEKNWKTALAVAGTAGAIGAAIWLTARYLRERKKRDASHESALQLIEDEVEASQGKAAVVLETGTYLGEIAGDDAKNALEELSGQMDEGEGKDALEVLKNVIKVNKKR